MKKRESISWKLYFLGVVIFLIAGVGIAVSIALSFLGAGWAWPMVAILVGVLIFLLVVRTRLANNFLPLLSLFFPIIGRLQEEAQKRFRYRAVIDKMEYTLEFFRLYPRMNEKTCIKTPSGHCSFTSSFREDLIKRLLEEQDPTKITRSCAERVVSEMVNPISAQVLELLYQERHGDSTLMSFQKIKRDDDLFRELANVLDESGRLPKHEDLTEEGQPLSKELLLEKGHLPTARQRYPYQISEITCFLSDSEAFSLQELTARMEKLQKIWEITCDYLAFLVMNRALPDDYELQVSDVLLSLDANIDMPGSKVLDDLTKQEKDMLNALWHAGDAGLAKYFDGSLSKIEYQSLNLIALGMYFTERRRDYQNLKSAVCRLAAENETAIRQHLAYLEYREDLREERTLEGLPFVSVKYIADHWEDTIENKKKELGSGFRKEMDAIRENLAEGNWWTRLPSVIDSVLEKIREELKDGITEVTNLVKNRPPVGAVLRRIFRGLKLETIERFLEARTITAYLLTFDGLSGSMATLVDCLSFFKGGKYRADLETKGVQFTYNNHEKYIFKEYIKQCRLGIVPMGMDFETFCHQFEEDLIIAFENRDELDLPRVDVKGFEIIIQRFGLSGRDRHGFDRLNREDQRKHALPRIQELFATSLILKDIIALIGYEQSAQDGKVDFEPIIDGILDLGTINDFLGDGYLELTSDQVRALNKNDQDLRQGLLRKMDFETLRRLAIFLKQDDRNRTNAKRTLTRLIRKIPEFEQHPQRCSQISQNYVETLADIAEIYK